MSQKKWFLYNTENGKKLSGVGVESAVQFAFGQSDEDKDHWLLNIEGESNWVGIRDLLQTVPQLETISNPYSTEFPSTEGLLSSQKRSIAVDEEAFESNVAASINSDGLEGDGEQIEINEDYSPRKFKRHNLALKVVIHKQGQVFQTTSLNISVHGMKIKDQLPDWAKKHCLLQLINESSGEEIQTICSPVKEDGALSNNRLRLSQFKSHQLESLFDEWLAG